jgi:hypothetical protein
LLLNAPGLVPKSSKCTSRICCSQFGQGILTLPDAGSYSSDAYHSLLVNYIVSVGLILGGDSNKLTEQAENIWQVEQQLAKVSAVQSGLLGFESLQGRSAWCIFLTVI